MFWEVVVGASCDKRQVLALLVLSGLSSFAQTCTWFYHDPDALALQNRSMIQMMCYASNSPQVGEPETDSHVSSGRKIVQAYTQVVAL